MKKGNIQKLSKNFNRKEFSCKCGCGQDTVDYRLIIILEELHEQYDQIYGECFVKVTSGNRCKEHNARTRGSSPNSGHITGKGVDIQIYYYESSSRVYIETHYIYEYLTKKYPNSYGIIKHDDFIHIDVKNRKYHKVI